MVTVDICEEEIKAMHPASHTVTNYVTVQKLNVGWLFKDGKDCLDLVRILNESSKNTRIFDTEFVNTLLEQFWREYKNSLYT